MINTFKQKNFVIGVLHFMPLIGYLGFTDFETILENARRDLKAFEDGGVDAIILENNYNLPHKTEEGKETIEMMLSLCKEISKISKMPLGISVLWNDYRAAFLIAKECNAKFIRVPVFVDDVKTDFGEILANPESVIKTRKELSAEDISIFADIQVKHAEMLNKEKTLRDSAKEAVEKGADAVIITGKWTGDAPTIENLREARETLGEDFPLIVGSGGSKENIRELLGIANGVIVSTSLKEDNIKYDERNVKPFNARIEVNKVKEFINEIR